MAGRGWETKRGRSVLVLDLNLSMNKRRMNIRQVCSATGVGVRLSCCRLASSNSVEISHSFHNRFSRNRRPKCPVRLLATPNEKDESEEKETSALKCYQVSGFGKRSRVELVTDSGHSISTDVPKAMGGQDLAPQPVETLLAALLGCTQATAVYVGRQMRPERVLIDRIEFNVSASRDERGALELPIDQNPSVPARVQSVTGEVTVYAKKFISAQQLELLREQTEVRCPIANLLIAGGCQLNICWKAAQPLV